MYAHKTRATVGGGHQITVELPSDFPEGEVEVIVLRAMSGADEERTASGSRRISVDELLSQRLVPASGVGPVSLADMEHAIADGAIGRGDV